MSFSWISIGASDKEDRHHGHGTSGHATDVLVMEGPSLRRDIKSVGKVRCDFSQGDFEHEKLKS